MSSEHNTHTTQDANWLDTWWPLLVILLGVIFFSIIIAWKPYTV